MRQVILYVLQRIIILINIYAFKAVAILVTLQKTLPILAYGQNIEIHIRRIRSINVVRP